MGASSATVFRSGEFPPDDHSSCAWIEVLNPLEQDFVRLQDRFKLHRLAVRDAQCARQSPKLDVYEDQIFVVLHVARLREDEVVYSEIDAFLGMDHIITVRRDAPEKFTPAAREPSGAVPASRSGPDFILHAITERVVGEYFPVVQMIEDEVLAMEQRLLDAFLSRQDITRLFRLRREAIHLRHVLTRMSDVCAKLANLEVPCVAAETRPFFRDVHDQLERLDAMTTGLVDVIGAVFEAGSLLELQRQGTSTRQLAAWAAILGAPAAVAALYEMNIPGLPGVESPLGLSVVVATMLALCIGLYVRFKKARWL
jgi:magnesium transporter